MRIIGLTIAIVATVIFFGIVFHFWAYCITKGVMRAKDE